MRYVVQRKLGIEKMIRRSLILAILSFSFSPISTAQSGANPDAEIFVGIESKRLEKSFLNAMNRKRAKAEKTSGFAHYEIVNDQPTGVAKTNPEVVKMSVFGLNCMKLEFAEERRNVLEVINEDYAFELVRPKNGNYYAITAIQQRGISTNEEFQFRRKISDARYLLFASSDFYGRTIWGLVQDPGFRLNKIEAIAAEDRKIHVRVDFDYEPVNKRHEGVQGIEDFTLKKAYLIFDPADDWNLVKCGRPSYPRSITTVTGTPSDQLAFTELATQTDSEDGEALESTVRCIQSSYDPIPGEHFYLSYYGFPEPIFRTSSSYWPWIVCSLIVGVVCIVVSRRLLHK
jgi:hypothetical protein